MPRSSTSAATIIACATELEYRAPHASNLRSLEKLPAMLKPIYQLSLLNAPRAICPSVVPNPFETLIWNRWPPARPSMPKLIWLTPGS